MYPIGSPNDPGNRERERERVMVTTTNEKTINLNNYSFMFIALTLNKHHYVMQSRVCVRAYLYVKFGLGWFNMLKTNKQTKSNNNYTDLTTVT